MDSGGNVYVADYNKHQIRKITKSTATDGTETWAVSSIAGDGTRDHRDGAGAQARFNNPTGVAVDSSGNVYVADRDNHRIRKITKSTATDGTDTWTVSTIAGNGAAAYRDGVGAQARFNDPTGVALDSSGNVYVADFRNHRIRKIEYKAP